MKTYVDLSWLRGKAKNVLIDEIRHVAVRNNFTLKCENYNLFVNADSIYFDTEKKEITDKLPDINISLEITVNNALQGKYKPYTTERDFKEYSDVILKNKINKKYKFHVGQRVQFKSWKEMASQYGLNPAGSIKTTVSFGVGMKYLCGTYATIIDFCGYENRCYLSNFSKCTTRNCYFNFTTEMLKPSSTKER